MIVSRPTRNQSRVHFSRGTNCTIKSKSPGKHVNSLWQHRNCWRKTVSTDKQRMTKLISGEKTRHNITKDWRKSWKRRSRVVWNSKSGEGLKADPDQSSSRHKLTTESERTDASSRIHSVSGKVRAQRDGHARSSQKHDREGCWMEVHWDRGEISFNRLKKLAVETSLLRFYDPTLPLTLSVDSSPTGLGCVVAQEGQSVACSSRALTKTQQNYAQIESH